MTAIALVVVLLVALMPIGSATITTTYGKIVQKKSSTTEPNTVTFDATVIALDRFLATNDGAVDWYLDMDSSGTTTVGDVRLNQVSVSGNFAVGTIIRSGDNDVGRTLPTSGVLCYIPTQTTAATYNYRGDNQLNPPHPGSNFQADGEPVYLMKNACTTVQAGQDQVRVTKAPSTKPNFGGHAAGSRVTTTTGTNTDVGRATVALTADHVNARVRFVDVDLSGGRSTVDPVYLVLDGTTATGPTVGDIRLWGSGSTVSFGSFTYGSYVDIDDMDVLKPLNAIGASLRFNAEGSGNTFPGCSSTALQHDIWLDMDASGTVTIGDVLLAKRSGASHNVTAGFPVRAGNTHLTTVLTGPISANLAYADNNGDSTFNFGDNIFLDIGGGSADNKVSSGDIQLSTNNFGQTSSTTFGSCITGSNNQVNQPLITTGFPPTFSYLSVWNAAQYQPGDLVYLGDTQVTLGDVRWSAVLTSFGSLGSVVDDDDADRTYTLSAAGFTPSICFTPTTGSTYRLEDPVYLKTGSATCATSLTSGDLRLSGTGTEAAGTTVEVGDHDFNDPVTQLANAVLRYVESSDTQGTSSSYDPFDEVYLDVDGGAAQVDVTDVRITQTTGGSPGTKVRSSDSDVSDTLRAFPAGAGGAFDISRVKFLKAVPSSTTTSTFSSSYRFTDVVVYDINNNGLVDLGDIFLSGTGGSSSLTGTSGGGGGGGGGTPTTPSNSAPVVIIECRGAIGEQRVNLDATKTYDPDGSINTGSYHWEFGDGTTGSGATTSHVYDSAGTFTVTLSVRDTQGAQGSGTYTVSVPLEQNDCRAEQPEPTETASPTPTDTASPTPTEEPEDTPAPGVVLVLLAFMSLALLMRRRS